MTGSTAKLIWITPEAEKHIAYMARVSNPTNQDNPDASKLIAYLLRNKHWSPFEMVSMCVEITTTRDIARQILRHRSFSFQEFSQRYADPTDTLGYEVRPARLQDPKNRQNSLFHADLDTAQEWKTRQQRVLGLVEETYAWAREHGIAKEVARAVLPEGMTVSRMYMSGTLRSWLHYVDLRTGNGTQWEHRLVAEEVYHILWNEVPSIMKAFDAPE